MATFQKVKLGDLISIKHGFAFLSKYFSNNGSHVVLTPGNFYDKGGFRRRLEKDKWYTGSILQDYLLKKGDLIIAMTEQGEGLLGSSAIIPESDLYLHNQRLGLVNVFDNKKADSRFLYYLFNLPTVRKKIRGSASGTKVRHTSPTRIYNITVDVPDGTFQARIATVLSAYDDLIENNEKRIKVLEEMAQLLYTEWFVKFKYPGHKKVKLIDSGTEYGMIPEGWEVKSLGNVVSFLEGPGLRNWQYRESGIPFINIRTIGNGDINIANCNYLDRTEVETKYPHFLLNVNDIVLSSSGTLGRLAVVRNRHLPICLNTSVIRFREIKNGLPIWFIKQYLLSEVFQNKIKGLASGAAQLNFGPSHLETISLVIPEADILRIYYQKISLVESEIGVLRDNIQTLSNTRDLLIPQLVTGKRELK